MNRKIRLIILPLLTAVLLLSGCKAPRMKFDSKDAAKEALNTADTIEIYCNLYSNSKTKILADGKVAGYLQGDTVYMDGEEWFHMDYVTDEPINNQEGVSSSTTYGFYAPDSTCLGYAQERYLDTEDGGRAPFLVFLAADGTVLDYFSTYNGVSLYNWDNEQVGTGAASKKGITLWERFYTNIYRTVFKTDPDKNATLDFMYRMAMFYCLQEDIRLVYDEPVNTGVQIFGTIAVLIVLFFIIGSKFAKEEKK